MKFLILIIGSFFLGGFSSYYFIDRFNSEEPPIGFDYNNDGILDEEYVYENGVLAKVLGDRNFDKEFDFQLNYLSSGHLKNSEFDDDFDGVFETSISYMHNQLNSVRVDTNKDGEHDFINFFEFGLLKSSLIINPQTKLMQKKSNISSGKWLHPRRIKMETAFTRQYVCMITMS